MKKRFRIDREVPLIAALAVLVVAFAVAVGVAALAVSACVGQMPPTPAAVGQARPVD